MISDLTPIKSQMIDSVMHKSTHDVSVRQIEGVVDVID